MDGPMVAYLVAILAVAGLAAVCLVAYQMVGPVEASTTDGRMATAADCRLEVKYHWFHYSDDQNEYHFSSSTRLGGWNNGWKSNNGWSNGGSLSGGHLGGGWAGSGLSSGLSNGWSSGGLNNGWSNGYGSGSGWSNGGGMS